LNKTEQLAYQWLKEHGVTEGSIVFQPHRSPDFLTDIGKFEVKSTKGKTIVVGENQLQLLEAKEATTFLVYTEDNVEPLVLTSQELQERFKILVVKNDPDKNCRIITIPIAIQRILKLQRGDKLIWSIENEHVLVRKK
jgi:hypothetical protein